ncbi:hypothetical protein [Akkermansia muciniphila]|uniref:hypothetical protein n=1 Tax=Akkermansia muciniphila TaxID=239935 RepID=UPI000C99FFEF|nr:hypothetical protein [Akkermansia muciniphila]PNC97333.1 hypothetical protein CXT94_03295 [Akkermansia muciniphila]
MIYLHYFTYRGHADLLTWTCRATLETLAHSPYVLGRDISIVVVDDTGNPCPEAAVSELKAMGATYRTSTFKRRGNLNGQDCIMGILSEFKRSMRRKKDIAVKLDCDTLLLGTTWLEQFVKDSSALVTGADTPTPQTCLCPCFKRCWKLGRCRHFLSETACQGILRRAAKRGKKLPPALERALKARIGTAAPIPPSEPSPPVSACATRNSSPSAEPTSSPASPL